MVRYSFGFLKHMAGSSRVMSCFRMCESLPSDCNSARKVSAAISSVGVKSDYRLSGAGEGKRNLAPKSLGGAGNDNGVTAHI